MTARLAQKEEKAEKNGYPLERHLPNDPTMKQMALREGKRGRWTVDGRALKLFRRRGQGEPMNHTRGRRGWRRCVVCVEGAIGQEPSLWDDGRDRRVFFRWREGGREGCEARAPNSVEGPGRANAHLRKEPVGGREPQQQGRSQ